MSNPTVPIINTPFGVADTSLALTATGTQALTITSNRTIVDGVTTQATGNRTLTIAASSELKAGAVVIVKSKTAATETTIFSTGCLCPTITGVAGKTKVQELVYDGTNFIGNSSPIQID